MPLADREAVAAARESGWEYAEDSATNLLQGLNADDTAWTGPRMVHRSPLPNLVCNGLVPASMKITGVRADPFAVHGYLETVFRRAGELGIGTLVFGSGAARAIPDEFDRSLGMRQIIDFLEVATGLAARHDVTIALEHLHEGETNVLNSLAECVAVARSLSHPRLKVMLDTYHLWTSDEPVDHVRDALPVLAHVHLADLAGRVAPGESGPGDSSDYRELFRVLKRGGYSGTMSVEALGFESHAYARVLEFVRAQWQA
jgi:sugar phosphate isomerase/epimerase